MSQTADELLSSLNQRDIARRLQEYQALLANDSMGILVVCDGERRGGGVVEGVCECEEDRARRAHSSGLYTLRANFVMRFWMVARSLGEWVDHFCPFGVVPSCQLQKVSH